MKKNALKLLVFCLTFISISNIRPIQGAYASNAVCRPGSTEINAMVPIPTYNFGICRGQAISAGKCCTKYPKGEICLYHVPGQTLSVQDVYSAVSTSPYKVKSCQDLLDHSVVSEKDYCPPDNQNYYNYNKLTKQCEFMAENPTFTCLGGSCATAVGNIPVDSLESFLTFALKFAFFASGGIIVLMIISTGYTIITSSGNPEKLQAAQENVIALFSGLALIAFSLVLLQALGAGILGLPGF